MIKDKAELKRYLALDKKVYGITARRPPLFRAYQWKFLWALRHEEYHFAQSGLYHRVARKFWAILHTHYGLKLGWEIPINTFGPGLKINHSGLIIVNGNARIGAFCDIHQGVNIGQHGMLPDDVPTIGDNVWIGPGAKIFGRIVIASRCAIGANAVVNRSFTEDGISIAGIPAKKISNTGNIWVKE
jgi:serine O-acetyltransferase